MLEFKKKIYKRSLCPIINFLLSTIIYNIEVGYSRDYLAKKLGAAQRGKSQLFESKITLLSNNVVIL